MIAACALIVATVGVAIALHNGQTHDVGAAPGQTTAPNSSATPSGSMPTPSSAGNGSRAVFLGSAQVDSGTGLIGFDPQHVAAVMPCPSGQSGDPARTVVFNLFGAYTLFTTVVTLAGPIRSETQGQLDILVGAGLALRTTLHAGIDEPISVNLQQAGSLTLTLSCGDPAGQLMFANPRITKN